MLRTRSVPLAAVAAIAAIALSACGASAGSSYTPADPYGSAPAAGTGGTGGTGAAATAPADAPAQAALVATEVDELGTIVTDADGFTLYRFDDDTAKPPSTTCVDACADKWPPVTVDPKGKLGLEGVEESVIGLVARPDGTSQLTIAGWPVYRFASDADPGSTKGQGVGGAWFAVTPEGKKAPVAP